MSETLGARALILTHGRSGSTFLVNTLNKHPHMRFLGEMFHPEAAERKMLGDFPIWSDDQDPVAYLHDTVYSEAALREHAVTGFKLMHFHCRNEEGHRKLWDWLVDQRSIKVIVLIRNNLLNAYISLKRAQEKAIWNPMQYKRAGEPESFYEPIALDPQDALQYVQRHHRGMKMTQAELGALDQFEVAFEDLNSDLHNKVNELQAFLGVPHRRPWFKFEPMNERPLDDLLTNAAEVRAVFADSPFASMVEA
ncbi:MAG: sulfotransferase [Maricaulaceae bacterium]